jgi:1,4-alpha-glucan branching enzyme
MAIKKRYSKNGEVCKVTFIIPRERANNFNSISLVGDFNEWNPDVHYFTETEKNGDYSVTLELPAGKQYQFRYLADGVQWFNDEEADGETTTYVGSTNSVLKL